ncbi:hypothetical protein AVEN_209165-1, partial [Araneus ventricosus]
MGAQPRVDPTKEPWSCTVLSAGSCRELSSRRRSNNATEPAGP